MKVVTKTLLFVALLLSFAFNSWAKSPDWTAYAEFLQQVKPGVKHETPLALVNYAKLKQSGQLEAVYQQISNFLLKASVAAKRSLHFILTPTIFSP